MLDCLPYIERRIGQSCLISQNLAYHDLQPMAYKMAPSEEEGIGSSCAPDFMPNICICILPGSHEQKANQMAQVHERAGA
jgi:hypothetical protein